MAKEINCFVVSTKTSESPYTVTLREGAIELAQRGHRVILLSTGSKKSVVENANLTVLKWPSARPTRWSDFVFLNRVISKYKPDCLVVDGYASSNIMLLTGWLRRVNARVTWYRTLREGIRLNQSDLQGCQKMRASLLIYRKYLLWKLTTPWFITNSNASRQDVRQYLSINERALQFPHLRFDSNIVTVGIEPDHLVCAGRLSTEKGQDTLIRALSILKDAYPGIRVEFLGDGTQRSEYESLAVELGVSEMCNFRRQVSHREVLERMANSYASVLPSLSEAFGLVNIESMSVGTPVIASRVGGIPDIVRDGKDGFLFSAGNHLELAEKLRALLDRPELRSEMSANARRRFEDTYEMSRNIGKLADLLEAIAKK